LGSPESTTVGTAKLKIVSFGVTAVEAAEAGPFALELLAATVKV
jgi:hypothetical protein